MKVPTLSFCVLSARSSSLTPAKWAEQQLNLTSRYLPGGFCQMQGWVSHKLGTVALLLVGVLWIEVVFHFLLIRLALEEAQWTV